MLSLRVSQWLFNLDKIPKFWINTNVQVLEFINNLEEQPDTILL